MAELIVVLGLVCAVIAGNFALGLSVAEETDGLSRRVWIIMAMVMSGVFMGVSWAGVWMMRLGAYVMSLMLFVMALTCFFIVQSDWHWWRREIGAGVGTFYAVLMVGVGMATVICFIAESLGMRFI